MILFLVACKGPPLSLQVTLSSDDGHAALVRVSAPSTVVCTTTDDERVLEVEEEGTIRGLLASEEYSCVAQAEGWSDSSPVQVNVEALPTDLPLPTVKIRGDAGFHLLQYSKLNDLSDEKAIEARYLAVLDDKGRPRWQFPGGAGDVDTSWVAPGQILFGGFGIDKPFPPTVVDLDGKVLWMGPDEVVIGGRPYGDWNHDVGLNAEGNGVMGLVRQLDTGPDDYNFQILELSLENGEVLWFWDAFTYAADVLPPPVGLDPYHANSVWEDGGRIYVSLRADNRVIAIDKATNQVLWSMGPGLDFALQDTDGQPLAEIEWFYSQHDVKVVGDLMYVYDNGNERKEAGGTADTRVAVYRIDEERRIATREMMWTKKGWFTFLWGGLDPIPGGYSVAASSLYWMEEGGPNAELFHLDAAGEELTWRVQFEDPTVSLYRSEWSAEFP